MGIFSKPISLSPKSYSDSGCDLTFSLVADLLLDDWPGRRPLLSPSNQQAIADFREQFQEGINAYAQSKGSETVEFHPEFREYLDRAITETALRLQVKYQGSTEDWTANISTYLKAWASGMNPWAMLGVAKILIERGKFKRAKEALEVAGKFPRYYSLQPSNKIEFTMQSYVWVMTGTNDYRSNPENPAFPDYGTRLKHDIEVLSAELGR
jgi:hypothetical protein